MGHLNENKKPNLYSFFYERYYFSCKLKLVTCMDIMNYIVLVGVGERGSSSVKLVSI